MKSLIFGFHIILLLVTASYCKSDCDNLADILRKWNVEVNWNTSDGCCASSEVIFCNSKNEITDLYLESKTISGELFDIIGNFKALQYLCLNNNNLSGKIPDSIGKLSELKYLDLSNNGFTELPKNIAKLSKLEYLYLQNNQINSELPSNIGDMESLIKIDISNNKFNGKIPKSFVNLSKLEWAIMNNNEISGNIPDNFKKLYKIRELNLNTNKMRGNIPSDVAQNLNVVNLNLGNNLFYGNLPKEFQFDTLNLEYFCVENNYLTGVIPESFYTDNSDYCVNSSQKDIKSLPSAATKPQISKLFIIALNLIAFYYLLF
ncbi:L domain-like protein [Anaeromyces robustus]|uniref:L domain-like protein n=1 Tax=Anaeromyces robustus TaxID=1754192 RepID=A0A1Y1XHD7_9FUNG|nr:L domain-like protein [Anaeromyces robustus]|eukprot:ORX85178.1 L domain-like protein [Anaeromyces robustus]